MSIQRGRKSAAQLAILPTIGGERPKPPSNLTATQAKVWSEIASTKAADWFNHDTFPLLAAYCRHIDSANLLAAQINAIPMDSLTDKDSLARYDLLLRMRRSESKSIVELATCMRLSQASRMRGDRSVAGNLTNQSADKPWAEAS